MPTAQQTAEALISGGPNFDLNDKMPVVIPPPSPEGDKPIDLDAFDFVKSGQRIEENKTPEPLSEDKAKIDPKVAEEAEKLKVEEEASQKALDAKRAEEEKQNKETPEVKPPPTARPVTPPKVDEVKLEEELKAYVPETAIPLLKKASKETQEFILAEFKRNKTALDTARAEAETAKKSVREGLPNAWYEHEQAFALTPEYQAAVQKSNTLKGYADHFRQELIKIKDGEKWVDLVLGADGKVVQQVREPGSAAEVGVLERIHRFEQALQQELGIAQNIAHNFRQQVNNVRGDMEKAEDEFFPQYKKGAAGAEDFTKNEHGQYVMKVLQGKGQGNNPIAGFLAKLYATFIEVVNENEKYKAAGDKGKKIAAVNNGPTGDEINRGSAEVKSTNIEDQPFDPDAFDKVINRMR